MKKSIKNSEASMTHGNPGRKLTSQFPHVVVVIEGGNVQTYVADQSVNLMIVDLDNEKDTEFSENQNRVFDMVDVDPERILDYVNFKDDWNR